MAKSSTPAQVKDLVASKVKASSDDEIMTIYLVLTCSPNEAQDIIDSLEGLGCVNHAVAEYPRALTVLA